MGLFRNPRKTAALATGRITGLDVYALGAYQTELSFGKTNNASKRVPLKADVDLTTGAVSFYVDPEAAKRIL